MRGKLLPIVGLLLLAACVEDTSGSAPDASSPGDGGGGGQSEAGPGDATAADAGARDATTSQEGGPPDAAAEASTADASSTDDGAVDAADAAPCPFADDTTVNASLIVTSDDSYALYVNGALVDDTMRAWSSPQTYAIKLFRKPSRVNVIAIAGANAAKIDGYDRGVVADLTYSVATTTHHVVTDATYRFSTTLQTGWFEVAFADTGWSPAVDEGPHGMAPWGAVLGTSSARWVWSFDSNLPAAQKDTQETVYLRKAFYLDMAGAPVTAASACP